MLMAMQAQSSQLEYCAFAQEGKTWEMQTGPVLERLYDTYVGGDTLIGGEVWKKVYRHVSLPTAMYEPSYFAAVRDAGQKVYALAKGSSRPRLIYDFSLKTGDLVRCGIEGNAFGCLLEGEDPLDTLFGFPFEAYLKLERIDTVIAHGLEHRRFILRLLDASMEWLLRSDPVVWIEGVGSGAEPFSPWMPMPVKDYTFHVSCKKDGNTLFLFPDDFYGESRSVNEELYHSWVLISYGNEQNEVMKESEGYYYLMTFHPDGRYTGQAYGNEMFGDYQCLGGEMILDWPIMTEVYYDNADPDDFFTNHLTDVSSYKIVNKELRLYFSGDQYFKFRLKDDNSMPDAITIHRTSKTKSNGIYNLQGRRIETSNFFDERSGKAERKLQTSKLNQGVYVENGRKIVVK